MQMKPKKLVEQNSDFGTQIVVTHWGKIQYFVLKFDFDENLSVLLIWIFTLKTKQSQVFRKCNIWIFAPKIHFLDKKMSLVPVCSLR